MMGALLNRSLTRVVPVAMVLLAVQKTVLVDLRPYDVVIQIVLAFAASIGAVAGPERGALTGFLLGIMFDLAVGTPLGSSGFTMALAGYAAGWVDTLRIETTWWMAAIFVGVGAAVGEGSVPVVRLFIGEEGAFVPDISRIVPIVAVTAAVASFVLVPIARWAMRLERPEWKVPHGV